MAIIVKKPSDDPYTWLGPEYTIRHFQEDIITTGELRGRGIVNDGNNAYHIDPVGNGYFSLSKQGNGSTHDLRYIYKDFIPPSTFVCSFDIGGPALSHAQGVAGAATGDMNSTFFGIVMKNLATLKLVTWGIDYSTFRGPSTVIRQYAHETVAKNTALSIYSYPFVDIAETVILKVVRKSSTLTDFYLSTDGVSFILIYPYDSAAGAGGAGPNPTPDTNRIGVGLDVIDNGTGLPQTHYATPYTISVDWIAYK